MLQCSSTSSTTSYMPNTSATSKNSATSTSSTRAHRPQPSHTRENGEARSEHTTHLHPSAQQPGPWCLLLWALLLCYWNSTHAYGRHSANRGKTRVVYNSLFPQMQRWGGASEKAKRLNSFHFALGNAPPPKNKRQKCLLWTFLHSSEMPTALLLKVRHLR